MPEPPKTQSKKKFDRAIVDGPIPSAVWKLAWPTMLQNVVAGFQGMVDHAMVGHYVGHEGNAAIGVSWQIFIVIVVFTSSLYTGMGVMVSRFAGADQPEKVDRVVYQAFLTSIFLGFGVFAPVGYFAAPHLLDLVNAEAAVQAEALPYLRILLVFGIGMLIFFMLGGALRAAGDAKTPLRLGVSLTVLNLVLNVVLIGGLGPIPAFGTQGAAMGTVIAGGLVSLYSLYLLFSGRLVVHFRREMGLRPDFKVIGSLFKFGLPTGFQGIAMNIGGIFLMRFVGSLDASAEAQAAYSVSYTQLFSLITWTSVALMGASATVAGQNLGAHQPERTRRVPRVAARMGFGVALPVAALFLFAPRALLGIFGLEDPTVLTLGDQLLGFLALSGVFLTTALSYTGALQGTGDTKSPLYISLVSQLILPLGLCFALDAWHGLRPWEIWLAIVLGHFTRAALSILRFGQGHWKEIEVSIDE